MGRKQEEGECYPSPGQRPNRPTSSPHLLPPAPRPPHRRVTAAMAHSASSAVGCHLPRWIRPGLLPLSLLPSPFPLPHPLIPLHRRSSFSPAYRTQPPARRRCPRGLRPPHGLPPCQGAPQAPASSSPAAGRSREAPSTSPAPFFPVGHRRLPVVDLRHRASSRPLPVPCSFDVSFPSFLSLSALALVARSRLPSRQCSGRRPAHRCRRSSLSPATWRPPLDAPRLQLPNEPVRSSSSRRDWQDEERRRALDAGVPPCVRTLELTSGLGPLWQLD